EMKLQEIASKPTRNNYFKFQNFSQALNSIDNLNSVICPDNITTECKEKGIEGDSGRRGTRGDKGERGYPGKNGECLILKKLLL
ncbi:hypothetical protein, partial [Salmonella sp. s51228]|uniref:hypothetical protein n=1 Tax=Salmonella sp. s51228 TaxID=3159652 RepID=UPI0039806F8B